MESALLMLVRSLKGAPLACLVVMRLTGRSLSGAMLGSLTGYSPHTVAQALQALQTLGLAFPDERRSNWRLSPAAGELDLWPAGAGSEDERDFCHPELSSSADILNFQESEAVAAGHSPRRSAKRVRRGLRRTTRPEPSPQPANVQPSNLQPVSQPADLPPVDPAVLQALRQAGIGEPTASRLAGMAHVDLAYVQAHAARARREGTPVPLLIHRMRSGDPPPPLLEKPGERYISGEFAEFIVH